MSIFSYFLSSIAINGRKFVELDMLSMRTEIRAIDDSKSKKRAIDDSLEDDGEKMLLDLV